MWQPWLKVLEWVGRLDVRGGPGSVAMTVGDPEAPDALGDMAWKPFCSPESLSGIWGPVEGSAWEAYHCLPLFASLDTFKRQPVGPTPPQKASAWESGPHLRGVPPGTPLGEVWIGERSMVVLDLPGPQSVALAPRFVAAGFQPVSTFDHWPHPKGLVPAQDVLSQLLRFSSVIHPLREHLTSTSVPMWICDRNRLGQRPGRPLEFDNRYYLDDSVLPGATTLRTHSIQHILCLVPEPDTPPTADLAAYFKDLRKDGFHSIHGVAASDPTLTPFDLPEDSRPDRVRQDSFHRSHAGGFGQLIPESSSGGG
jgi:hypothetical protein